MNSVKKKIHFFRIIEKNCDILESLKLIDQIPEGSEMYSKYSYSDFYLQEVSISSLGYATGIIRSIRPGDLPMKVQRGVKAPKELGLNDDEALGEAAHFVIFCSGNIKILAMEYNYHGPKSRTLEMHINNKLNIGRIENSHEIQFQLLLSTEFLSKLDKIGFVSVVDLVVSTEKISAIQELDENLYSALEAAKNFGGSKTVELVLRSKKKSKVSIIENIPNFVSDLKTFLKGGGSGNVERFRLRALDSETGILSPIDLLEDKVESCIEVVKLGTSREIDAAVMFSKMIEAFNSKKGIINLLVSNQDIL